MDEATRQQHTHQESLPALAIGAIGVVFGDIGTSPLYALRESFVGHHPLAVDREHIFGVLSLIFWTMMLIVTIKYVWSFSAPTTRARAEAWRCSL
jgi:KUP system potassium uptake protein